MLLSWSDIKSVSPLHEDEQIVLVTREHWIIPFMRVVVYSLFVLFLWIIGWVINTVVTEKIVVELYHSFSLLATSFIIL